MLNDDGKLKIIVSNQSIVHFVKACGAIYLHIAEPQCDFSTTVSLAPAWSVGARICTKLHTRSNNYYARFFFTARRYAKHMHAMAIQSAVSQWLSISYFTPIVILLFLISCVTSKIIVTLPMFVISNFFYVSSICWPTLTTVQTRIP